jgi:hypothetical protein
MTERERKRKPTPVPSRFAVGCLVRIKPGVIDPEYPDMPLGGWLGTIAEVQEESYLVRWSEATLQAVHPTYHERCERDGVDFSGMWFQAEELEADPGEPLSIEPPIKTDVRSRP